jgi:hypothetical protein
LKSSPLLSSRSPPTGLSPFLEQNLLAILFALLVFSGLTLISSGGTEDYASFLKWLLLALEKESIAEGYRLNGGGLSPLAYFQFLSSCFFIDLTGPWKVIPLSILLHLLLSTYIYYRLSRNLSLSIGFYFAFFYGAMVLKYVDINFAPYLLLSLYFLQHKKYILFGAFFTISGLIKWQPLIIAPFLLLFVWHPVADRSGYSAHKIPALWQAAAGSLMILATCTLYFSLPAILSAFKSVAREPWLSGNALNIHWIVTYLLHKELPEIFGRLDQNLVSDDGPLLHGHDRGLSLPLLPLAHLVP